MTEANPPAQPKEELRRRILFLVAEPHRRSEPPYHDEIAEELNEAADTVRDHLLILEHKGFVFLQTVLDTLIPNITPEGLLEVEKMAQTAPQPDPPPISEPSPEPQEFEHSVDYRRVDWQGKKFRFSPMQSRVVRLLHEEFKEGRDELGAAVLLDGSDSTGEYVRDIFRRHCAWGTLIIKGEGKGTHKLNLLP